MKKLIAILLTLGFLIPTGSWAAIALDDATNSGQKTDVSTFSWNHTTAAGTDRVLVVGVSTRDGGQTSTDGLVTGITYNGVAMTEVDNNFTSSAASNYRLYSQIWILVNPDVGTNSVAVTLTGTANDAVGIATTLTGVDQIDAVDAFNSNNSTVNCSTCGTDVTVSVVTATVDAWIIDNVTTPCSSVSLTVDASQTQLENVSLSTNNNSRGAASYEGPIATPASTVMNWTSGNTVCAWTTTAVSLIPASDAPASTPADLVIGSKNLIIGTKNLIIN